MSISVFLWSIIFFNDSLVLDLYREATHQSFGMKCFSSFSNQDVSLNCLSLLSRMSSIDEISTSHSSWTISPCKHRRARQIFLRFTTSLIIGFCLINSWMLWSWISTLFSLTSYSARRKNGYRLVDSWFPYLEFGHWRILSSERVVRQLMETVTTGSKDVEGPT